MRILLINNYDSYADLLAYTLGCVSSTKPTVVYNDALHADDVIDGPFDHIVLSPGPGHPARRRDFGICAEVIARARVPLLGVCLGHQGIALFRGGKLIPAPELKHGKRSGIAHNNHPLFAGVPSPFTAMRYHSWVVDETTLPKDVQVLARAREDGTVMALALRDRPVVGVQFHPESVGTPQGRRILANFLQVDRPRDGMRRHVTRCGAAPPKRAVAAARDRPAPRARVAWMELAWRDPEQVFAGRYRQRPYAFWLDTAAPSAAQRWSFMGAPHQVIRTQAAPWSAWRRALGAPPEGASDLPCPFAGGLVGWLDYELHRHGHDALQSTHQGPSSTAAQTVMQDCRRFYAFDHVERRVYAVAVDRDIDAAQAWLQKSRAGWLTRQTQPSISVSGDCVQGAFWPREVTQRIDRAGYMRRIAEAQRRIRLGDIYEVCLSNRFDAPADVDPWHLYRILRHTHPAPYAAFIQTPDASVLSVSPERFLTLDADGTITTEPIKGTRAHTGTRGALHFQRRQLRHSRKDQAELLMIVDLLRNDLARVAQSGSICVPELFHLTDHPTVVQLSATIRAQLRRGHDAIDLLRACYPGGSITGAPKRRAMEIIQTLEGHPRHAYTGAIGYLSACGTMNMNLAIRTMAHKPCGITFGAGGAITADSDPDGECDEVEAKAFALARAIALARRHACGGMQVHAPLAGLPSAATGASNHVS